MDSVSQWSAYAWPVTGEINWFGRLIGGLRRHKVLGICGRFNGHIESSEGKVADMVDELLRHNADPVLIVRLGESLTSVDGESGAGISLHDEIGDGTEKGERRERRRLK